MGQLPAVHGEGVRLKSSDRRRSPSATRHLSPLRYPGGKNRLANFIKLIVQNSGLLDGHYVEPYAGGASVGLSLLFDEYVSHIHINDLDPGVHAFWHSVLNHTDRLCRLIRDRPLTMDEWRRQRAIHQRRRLATPLSLGFATFYLNRTNRSGIIASGGVIGGNDQTGKWKLDARYTRSDLIARVEAIAGYRDRISLYRRDAASLLRTLLPKLPTRTLTYLDPPYYVMGGRLYANYYRAADHAKLAKLVSDLHRPWIVSYDNVPEIRKLYPKFRSLVYDLSYSATERYDGSEVMFFSDELEVPTRGNPTSVTPALIADLEMTSRTTTGRRLARSN